MTVQKKQEFKWNVVVMVAIGILGVSTSQIDRITGKAVNVAQLTGKIEHNTQEIHRVDIDGCGPSEDVRRDSVGWKKDIEANTERSKENSADMKLYMQKQELMLQLLQEIAGK